MVDDIDLITTGSTRGVIAMAGRETDGKDEVIWIVSLSPHQDKQERVVEFVSRAKVPK